MTTTFLLHGGRLRNKDVRNDRYFAALTEGLSDRDIILHIPFARDEDAQLHTFEEERGWILAQTDKDVDVVMARRDTLLQQIRDAKVVHITGGDCPKLVEVMKSYPDFVGLLEGKRVGGSSAGACLFAEYYWTSDTMAVEQGLAVLPMALMVHYGSQEFSSTDVQLEHLRPYATEGIELLCLQEAEWVVRYG